MKTNYQLETDKIIKSLGDARPTLLLLSCCGPCSSYVLEYLTQYFEVTLLFYNPCIQPEAEYEKRLKYQRMVLEQLNAKILECKYDGEAFEESVARGYESAPEGGERCTRCFVQRLEKTAREAAAHGFDYYCTTLSVSPHKDAARLNRIGEELGKRYGVQWLPSDFKKRNGYLRSIRLAKEYGLYRQDWCGCRYSHQSENPSDE